MTVPKEEFAAWFDWAKEKFADARSYSLIDAKVYNFDLLSDAYEEVTNNDATREHLESQLAHAPNEIATRFVILNYYYELSRFDSDRKEEYVTELRNRFRRDLAFFVRLRALDECTGVRDISWEITNACAIRDWARTQALYARLRSTQEIEPGTFHAAYGHFLFHAAFGNYDPEDPVDDAESLSQWSISIVNRRPKLYLRKPQSFLKDVAFEITLLGLGLVEHFSLPTGRPDELLRDAKNELEKARDTLPEFRPGLRCALARCYMARGEYRWAADEYRVLGDVLFDQMAWTGMYEQQKPLGTEHVKPPISRSQIWARVATALELADDDPSLQKFLEHWISLEPDQLGPRERLAKLEARRGNYEAAFRYLSEEHSMNPAHDQDWKATLLVQLGARAHNEERVAEIVRESIEKTPEVRVIMEGIVEDYWPTFRLLTPEAKGSFRVATRLLFDSTIGEHAWDAAATQAGKSVELELRASLFEPFRDWAKRTAPMTSHANVPGTRPGPLVAFIERGSASPLTLGAMINYLLKVPNPKEGVERSLRDWLSAHRPKLFGALKFGTLNANADVGDLRNRATHETISREDAAKLYKSSRAWLDELTRDK
jgi:tetratricopeptide (TPR) repeat protein